jgi:hypothetical protein
VKLRDYFNDNISMDGRGLPLSDEPVSEGPHVQPQAKSNRIKIISPGTHQGGADKYPVLSGYHPAGGMWAILGGREGGHLEARIKFTTGIDDSNKYKWTEWMYLREGPGVSWIPTMAGYSVGSPVKKYHQSPTRRDVLEDIKAAFNAIGARAGAEYAKGGGWNKSLYRISGLKNTSVPLVSNGTASFGWEDPHPGMALMINELEAQESGELIDPRKGPSAQAGQ